MQSNKSQQSRGKWKVLLVEDTAQTEDRRRKAGEAAQALGGHKSGLIVKDNSEGSLWFFPSPVSTTSIF